MHKLMIISPLTRRRIWREYNEKMRVTKWKKKEECYLTLGEYYHVHFNTIRCPQTNRKIERFWKVINDNFWYKYDFTSHKDFKIRFMDWLTYYNLKRPHWGIEYMTPIQKFEKLLVQNLVCILFLQLLGFYEVISYTTWYFGTYNVWLFYKSSTCFGLLRNHVIFLFTPPL